jgi:hypothetical protein
VEPSTELVGAKGEERGVLTTSDVVVSVMTTSSLEGRDGETRMTVVNRRRNGMIRAVFVTFMAFMSSVVVKGDGTLFLE